MPRRSFRDLNLNQLVGLDHLLRERNVTRAALQMGVSQPTASADLARLRRHFDDPLLLRVEGGYTLSPLGRELQPLVREALKAAHRVFSAGLAFDPTTSDREFVLHGSDYLGHVLAPAISRAVSAAGPRLSVHLRRLPEMAGASLDETLRNVDALFIPRGAAREFPSIDVLEDRWACIVDIDNTEVGDRLTLEDAGRLPWAATPMRGGQPLLTMHPLRAAGVDPHVVAVADSFVQIPWLVAGTDRVAVVQSRLLDAGLRERVREVGYVAELPPISMAMFWHPTRQPDPGHSWLCDTVTTAASTLPPVRR